MAGPGEKMSCSHERLGAAICEAPCRGTVAKYAFAFSRHKMPELCQTSPSAIEEGAGNAGCWPHPWPASKRKSWRQLPQVQPEQSGIPCAMVLRLISRSPWEPGFLAPIARSVRHASELGLSVGRPGPHDFAVRLSVVRPHENTRASPKRPPQSRLTCRDDRDAPLFIEAGSGENTRVSVKRKQNFFAKGPDSGFNRPGVESPREFRFFGHRMLTRWRSITGQSRDLPVRPRRITCTPRRKGDHEGHPYAGL